MSVWFPENTEATHIHLVDVNTETSLTELADVNTEMSLTELVDVNTEMSLTDLVDVNTETSLTDLVDPLQLQNFLLQRVDSLALVVELLLLSAQSPRCTLQGLLRLLHQQPV